MSIPLHMRERRKGRKPTGYHVKFTIVTDFRENGWLGTGAGETYAHSLPQLNSVLRSLNRRMDLRAEVITIWGPLATPIDERESETLD